MAATRPGIAGLPMYDMPALAWATDALWTAIARDLAGHGMAGVPDRLRRDIEPETLWIDPGLLLAQTCGLPLVTLLDGRVRFVATPIYAVDGCSGGDYRSWLVVRAGDGRRSIADLEGSIAAVNAPHSQSGANALAAMTAPVAKGRAFFADIRLTGAHAASLAAVSRGAADCAAIDCVTWALLAQSVPEVHIGLEILAASPPVPSLPYITGLGRDDATILALRRALGTAAADPQATAACRRLGFAGIAATDAAAYQRIRDMLESNLSAGCSRLSELLGNSLLID
jgi:ABC-type phosphate/phosphonate transport system substrate-binding protein